MITKRKMITTSSTTNYELVQPCLLTFCVIYSKDVNGDAEITNQGPPATVDAMARLDAVESHITILKLGDFQTVAFVPFSPCARARQRC